MELLVIYNDYIVDDVFVKFVTYGLHNLLCKEIINMKNTLIVCAMEKELRLIAQKLSLKQIEKNIWSKDNITLLMTGIGKQRTAIALTKYLCENPKPDLIINVGYAGSTDIKVGEWVNITRAYNYEWDSPSEGKYFFLDYGNQNLDQIENNSIKKVECYSAERFVTSTDLTGHIAFDMELHSIAVICDMFSIPLMSLKKISDNLCLDDYYDNIKNNENVFELDSCTEILGLK